MTDARIALCVDELTCTNPALVGLGGERFDQQGWLDVYNWGAEMRQSLMNGKRYAEAWVVSCEDVEPINLAATLKSDNAALPVRLVVREGCGSLLSRAHNARIDEVVGMSTLPRRYAEAKGLFMREIAHPAAGQPVGESAREADAAAAIRAASPASTTRRPGVQGAPTKDVSAACSVEDPPREAPRVHEPELEAKPLVFPVRTRPQSLERSRGFIMPVVSGSGGAGKSSVSVLASLVACDMGYKTLLLDYDLQFGDAALLAGVKNAPAIDFVLDHPEYLEHEQGDGAGLTVVAAPERLELAEKIVSRMPAFLDAVTGMYDLVIANTGAAWAEQHAVLLERSYTALFLVDQRASSLRACKHALELCARCGIATGPFEYLLNRCGKGAPLTSADVSCALQDATVYELRDGGRLVEDYLGSGAARELLAQGNEFGESIRQVMAQLLPGKAHEPGDMPPEQGARHSGFRGRHVGRKRGKRS